MKDVTTSVQQLKEFVGRFIAERDWNQFHTPKSLSMGIAVEAAELMEKFQWCDNSKSYKEAEINREEVEQELADVIITAICFANAVGIDISKVVQNKMELNAAKYPVHKAKGRYTKYDKL